MNLRERVLHVFLLAVRDLPIAEFAFDLDVRAFLQRAGKLGQIGPRDTQTALLPALAVSSAQFGSGADPDATSLIMFKGRDRRSDDPGDRL